MNSTDFLNFEFEPLEILAPAGSFEALVAAVRSGANAVYFGADGFNARRNAENFGQSRLCQAVDYCHRFGVKAYLTLNTLISDAELPQAVSLAVFAANAGIDALIVQDFGLCSILHTHLPQIELHASTQMSVHSPAALPFLKKLGITRVVAAREMSQEELRTFCAAAKRLGMQVEVFIHGALCMSVSGQCYFSAFLGGRSANRGLCAGTCRLPFRCNGAHNVLSLKDLSLIHHLQALQKMGVSSAKIEGRMKRPEYVAAAVHCAAAALKSGAPNAGEGELLRSVFSRSGFTDGYFTAKRNAQMFGARTKEDAVRPATLKQLHQYYRFDPQPLPLKARLELLQNYTQLTLTSGKFSVAAVGPKPEPPLSTPLGGEKAQQCLEKLGGTPYRLSQFCFNNSAHLTIRLGALNQLKALAVQQLDDKRLQAAKQSLSFEFKPPVPQARTPKGWFLRLQSQNQLPQSLPGILGCSLPAQALVKCAPTGAASGQLWAELPRTNFNENAFLKMLSSLKSIGIQRVVVQNPAQIEPALQAGFETMGGFGLNIYNSQTATQLFHSGLCAGVLSPELGLQQLPAVCAAPAPFKLFSFCYGYFPLMLLRNCPVAGHGGCKRQNGCSITDRMGERFRLSCSGESIQLYNNRPIYFGDKFSAISADGGYLYFTHESAEEVQSVISHFQGQKKWPALFTRGLLQTGVK